MEDQTRKEAMRLISYGVPSNLAHLAASRDPAQLGRIKNCYLKVAEWYDKQPNNLLVITGGERVGKTLSSAIYMMHDLKCKNPKKFDGVWERNEIPKFLSLLELQAIEFDQFTPLSAPPVLVIDDLGGGLSEGNMIKSLIFALVQRRTFDGLITIVTSQMTMAELGKRYGQRFKSFVFYYGQVLTV